MKKRRRLAFLYTAVTMAFMLVATVFVFNSDRRFTVKNQPFIATEFDFDFCNPSYYSDETAFNYILSNGINTVILPFNDGSYSLAMTEGFTDIYKDNAAYEKQDFIKQLKKSLAEEKIQLYVMIDCQDLSDENILAATNTLGKNYALPAIVLKNYNGSTELLQQISALIPKKCNLFLMCGNSLLSQTAAMAEVDGYICTEMDYNQYKLFKATTQKTVLLHYNTPSLESDIFVATNFGSLDGAVISLYNGNYQKHTGIEYALGKNEKLPLFNLSVLQDFTVTYPTKDVATYYSGIFITGTGAQGTVNINGTEYASQTDGTFGVYLELTEGENPVTVTSGTDSKTFTVTRKVYKSTGNTVKKELPRDESVKLNPGRIISTTSQLTSVLSDPEDDSSIIAGLDPGTKLVVAESVEAERSGVKTYAYKLTNGGYIPSEKVEILDEITQDYKPSKKEKTDNYTLYENPVIAAINREKLENSDRILHFSVNNMPGITHEFTQDKLTVFFMDTSIEEIPFPKTAFYCDYTITQTETGTQFDFILDKSNPLWGYDIKSEEGTVKLYLKNTPQVKNSEKPLTGITILLDAGHGGKDSGALGVASTNGPLEKDLNLAVAQATKAILESNGATVLMTREDDIFPTLDDRRNMVRDIKPDLFIAIHHNSMDYSYDSTKARGSECYYFTHQSKTLAQALAKNVTASTGRLNRGAFNGRYYVTRTDICPSVLMEYGFMINPAEFSTLYSNTDIYKAAYGTTQAVVNTIQ